MLCKNKPIVYSMDEYKDLRRCLDILLNKYESYKKGNMVSDEFKFLCLSSKDGIFGENAHIVDMYLRTGLSFSFDVNFDHKYAINHIILDFLNENRIELFKKIINYLYECCEVYKNNFENEYMDVLEKQKNIDKKYDEIMYKK